MLDAELARGLVFRKCLGEAHQARERDRFVVQRGDDAFDIAERAHLFASHRIRGERLLESILSMKDVPGIDGEPRQPEPVTELCKQLACAPGRPYGLVVPAKMNERLKQRIQRARSFRFVPCGIEHGERLLMTLDRLLVGSQCPERISQGPQGESAKVLVFKPAGDGVCRLRQRKRPPSVDVKLLAGGGDQPVDDRGLQELRSPVETDRPAGVIRQFDQGLDRFFQNRAQNQTS